jgi:lysophospholipase L1-like esterase
MRLRSLLANLTLSAATILLCLIPVEAYLRLSDSNWELQRRLFADPSPTLHYQSFPSGLFVLAPDQNGRHVTPCLDVAPISVDHQGFRGNKSKNNADIVLLGDSFVEALQVPDGLTVAERLEALLGQSVMNAGVSGYATTHELLAWRERLARLKPKLLVLFVYLGNDISGNSCELSQTLPPCGKVGPNGVTFFQPAAPEEAAAVGVPSSEDNASFDQKSGLQAWRQIARRNLALYALAHDFRVVLQGLTNEILGRVDSRWGLYKTSVPDAWRDAWRITEVALGQLRAETHAQGTRLVLVAIPEFAALAPDPKPLVRFGSGSAYPNDFDASLPSRRLLEIAKRLDIPALDLLPVITAYRDRFALPSPYVSYRCDGHWNPLGHALAADAVANFLVDHHLTPGAEQFKLSEQPPQAILDTAAIRQIFGNGVYKPSAAH